MPKQVRALRIALALIAINAAFVPSITAIADLNMLSCSFAFAGITNNLAIN